MASTNTSLTPEMPPLEDRFACVIEDLIEMMRTIIADLFQKKLCTINPALLKVAGGFIGSLDSHTVITNFIEYSHEFWDQISERDEKFFVENCKHVFRDLPITNPGTHIDAFKMLYESRFVINDDKSKTLLMPNDDNYENGKNVIDDEEKRTLWNFFDILVRMSIKYIHDKRVPTVKIDDEGKEKLTYKINAFPNVKKLNKLARTFDAKLEWLSSKSN